MVVPTSRSLPGMAAILPIRAHRRNHHVAPLPGQRASVITKQNMGSHSIESHASREGGDLRAILDGLRRVVQVLRESSRAAERRIGLSSAQLFVLQRLA